MTLGLWDRLSQRCAPQDTVVVVPGQLMDDRGGTFAHIGLFRGRVYPPANSSAGIGVPVLARQDADKLDAAMDTMGLILRAKRAPLALMDVPGVSHDPLVDEIMKYVGGLRRVLSDPAALLDREPQDRRVPTSGRITRGTLARLSGHSEDWDRLLPEGPQPRRLRVERLEERFDLHENRIFVDALVNLERLVRKRTALVGQATDANQEAKGLADTTYQARSRIANALMEGRGDLDDTLARMAEALMQASQRLRRLRGTISAAKSCEPATSLGWKRFSEPILQTNLFISDPKYADVAAAARLLRNQGDNTSAAREARLQKSKERQEGFDLYTRELLEREFRSWRVQPSVATPKTGRSRSGGESVQ